MYTNFYIKNNMVIYLLLLLKHFFTIIISLKSLTNFHKLYFQIHSLSPLNLLRKTKHNSLKSNHSLSLKLIHSS